MRQPNMRTLFAALCLLIVSRSAANAEMTVSEYRQRITSTDATLVDVTKVYIKGLGEGIGWGNAEKEFYCQPAKLALGMENFLDIIDRQIKELSTSVSAAKLDEMWIGLLLSQGLQRTFPCPSRK